MEVKDDPFYSIGMEFTENQINDLNYLTTDLQKIKESSEEMIREYEYIKAKSQENVAEMQYSNLSKKRIHKFMICIINNMTNFIEKHNHLLTIDANKLHYIDITFKHMLTIKLSVFYSYEKFDKNKLNIMFNDLKKALSVLDLKNVKTHYDSFEILINRSFDVFESFYPKFKELVINRDEVFHNKLDDINSYISDRLYEIHPWKKLLSSEIGLISKDHNKQFLLGEIFPNKDLIEDLQLESGITLKQSESDMEILDESDNEKARIILDVYFSIVRYLNDIINEYYTDIVKILKILLPKNNVIKRNKRLIDNIEKINPWISADYHLLKELRSGNKNTDRTMEIIEMHNKYVKPNDVFLFLGDISEQEFFDYNNDKILKELRKYITKLNGRKILIIGNNDTGSDAYYKSVGFEEIYHDPIITTNYIFSHGPIKLDNDKHLSRHLNIHGHIHGCKHYWNMETKNHIDCYFGIWERPVKLNELVNFYKQGLYKDCVKEIKYYSDPESSKTPLDVNVI